MRRVLLVVGVLLVGAVGAVMKSTAETMSVSPFTVVLPSSTIGGLPVCGANNTGLLYMVTDALTPVALATVVAGGAVKVSVMCNGTNWIVS